jgi:MOSC domain-containing protein YiiM
MAIVSSVNIGAARHAVYSDIEKTGIDKVPTDGPVRIDVPVGSGSGLAGDVICDVRHHGGVDQAVYAYAREDLDEWAGRLGRELRSGMFGENLTISGMDVNAAVIGERWRVGNDVVLEVSVPRIPCRTFAGWLGEKGWVKSFTQRAASGTYLRVITPGTVAAGATIEVIHRPAHGVTVETTFRALTTAPELLPRLLDAPELPHGVHDLAARRTGVELDRDPI